MPCAGRWALGVMACVAMAMGAAGAWAAVEPLKDRTSIQIDDSETAQLGVVVSTNGDLTAATESWDKAKVEGATVVDGEAILTIPAPAEKGFFIVNPKPDVPSDLIEPPHTTVR